MKEKKFTVSVTIQLEKTDYDRLENYAKENGKSISATVREIVIDVLDFDDFVKDHDNQ